MDSILSCLCGASHTNNVPPTPQANSKSRNDPNSETQILAIRIITLLSNAPTEPAFQSSFADLVSTTTQSWSEALATSILHALEETLQNADRSTWSDLLTCAYNSAVELAKEEFTELVNCAREHPLEVAATVLV
ncbi:hypothetical protein V8F06_010035 [Rhypophila decipiens]